MLTITSPDSTVVTITDSSRIETMLHQNGIMYEIVPANSKSKSENYLEIYEKQIASLVDKYKFQSVDVVNSTNIKASDLEKFTHFHSHDDFEIRWFVKGSGVFTYIVDEDEYAVSCDAGTFISLPANMLHSFYPKTNFACIRFFTDSHGWVAKNMK